MKVFVNIVKSYRYHNKSFQNWPKSLYLILYIYVLYLADGKQKVKNRLTVQRLLVYMDGCKLGFEMLTTELIPANFRSRLS